MIVENISRGNLLKLLDTAGGPEDAAAKKQPKTIIAGAKDWMTMSNDASSNPRPTMVKVSQSPKRKADNPDGKDCKMIAREAEKSFETVCGSSIASNKKAKESQSKRKPIKKRFGKLGELSSKFKQKKRAGNTKEIEKARVVKHDEIPVATREMLYKQTFCFS